MVRGCLYRRYGAYIAIPERRREGGSFFRIPANYSVFKYYFADVKINMDCTSDL